LLLAPPHLFLFSVLPVLIPEFFTRFCLLPTVACAENQTNPSPTPPPPASHLPFVPFEPLHPPFRALHRVLFSSFRMIRFSRARSPVFPRRLSQELVLFGFFPPFTPPLWEFFFLLMLFFVFFFFLPFSPVLDGLSSSIPAPPY